MLDGAGPAYGDGQWVAMPDGKSFFAPSLCYPVVYFEDGDSRSLFNDCLLINPAIAAPSLAALESDSLMLIGDRIARTIYRVDLRSGATTIASGPDDPGPDLDDISQLGISPDRGTAYAVSSGLDPAIVAIDLTDGSRATLAEGSPFVRPQGLLVGPDGVLFVTDAGPGGVPGPDRIFKVAANGTISELSGAGDGADELANPFYMVLATDELRGACCVGEVCFTMSESHCQQIGGDYQGMLVPCGRIACPDDPVGACCFGSECAELKEYECTANGGLYLGDGVDCASCVPLATPMPARPSPRLLSIAGPHPARMSLQYRVSLARDTAVTVAVYDAAGRRLVERRLLMSAGSNLYTWDLSDEDPALRPGVYFLRISAGEVTEESRFVIAP